MDYGDLLIEYLSSAEEEKNEDNKDCEIDTSMVPDMAIGAAIALTILFTGYATEKVYKLWLN